MSVGIQSSALPATGLPVVNQALEPTWVRDGSQSTKNAYDTALTFEQMLVEQLSKSMAATSGLGGESSEEGESGSEESSLPAIGGQSTELSSMLPQALSSGVMSAGGLGLAAQMTSQLQDPSGVSQTPSSVAAKSPATAVGTTGGSGS
jgi:Rod binding domain-containing protein